MTAKYNIQLQDSLFDGSYEILAPVGRGRNSVVYKARDVRDPEARTFALKVLVAGLKDPSIICTQAYTEAMAMRACEDANVTRLFDYVATPSLCYLVMDYAAGGDLGRYLSTHKEPLPVRLALPVMEQVLSGLQAIHAAGYIHRDIKPENILINGQGAAKISDFGIAIPKVHISELADAGRGVGTFEYLAPESLNDGVCDEHTDVYAAAVTFYQLLSAVVPFSGDSFSQQVNHKLNADLVPLSYLVPGVSRKLSAAILKALQPSRSERFESIEAFREAILESVKKPRALRHDESDDAVRETCPEEELAAVEPCAETVPQESAEPVYLKEETLPHAAEEIDHELSEETLLDEAGYKVLAHSSADDLPTLKSHSSGLAMVQKKRGASRILRNTSILLVLAVSVGIFSLLSSSWSLDSAKALVGSLIKSEVLPSSPEVASVKRQDVTPQSRAIDASTSGMRNVEVHGASGFAALTAGALQGQLEAYRGAERAYSIFTYVLPDTQMLVIEVAGPGKPQVKIPFRELQGKRTLMLKGENAEIELRLHPKSEGISDIVFGTYVEKSTLASGSWSIQVNTP